MFPFLFVYFFGSCFTFGLSIIKNMSENILLESQTKDSIQFSKPILGIGIDGVIRDIHTQFYKIYKKAFIKNESLVQMDDNYNYVPEMEMTEDDLFKMEQMEKEKINTPINSFDLLNHFKFESAEDFEKFYFTDYAFEIFGAAGQFQRAMDYVNRLQDFGKANSLFETVLLSKESDKAITSTYHFLAKNACKIKKIIFVDEYVNKWDYCNVIIDDCPIIFENKPENKTSIKINREYNVYSKSDYSFDSINEVYNHEFLLKIFKK